MTNKFFTYIIALLGVTNLVFSQAKMGFRLGINNSDVSYTAPSSSSAPTISSIIKFAGGIYFDVPINKNISFNPELLFVSKGHKESIIFFGRREISLNYEYIELPILFKFKPTLQGFVPYALAGLAPAFMVNRYYYATGSATVTETKAPNVADLGLMIGGGFDLNIERAVVSVDVRYNVGVTNYIESTEIKHRGLYVLLGIGFPLSKSNQ